MKTLFLSSNCAVEASVRYRVYQFLDYFRSRGNEYELSHFFDNQRGASLRLLRGLGRRLWDLRRVRGADAVFIHREILPLALNGYVRLLSKKIPIIFDFDDAVFLPVARRGWRSCLACPESTRLLVERSAVVYAGNEFLADYAAQFNPQVRIVPTVVDTDRFVPSGITRPQLPILGWVGSASTAGYLDQIMPALEIVAKSCPFQLHIVGAEREFSLSNAQVRNLEWTSENEVASFQNIDVGLYPLLDDVWSRGKCGFKAIQYLACGVPCVVSPVGVVRDIVRNGVDGVWASSPQEWIDGTIALLRSPGCREKMGAQGRVRAVERYSLASIAPSWVDGIQQA